MFLLHINRTICVRRFGFRFGSTSIARQTENYWNKRRRGIFFAYEAQMCVVFSIFFFFFYISFRFHSVFLNTTRLYMWFKHKTWHTHFVSILTFRLFFSPKTFLLTPHLLSCSRTRGYRWTTKWAEKCIIMTEAIQISFEKKSIWRMRGRRRAGEEMLSAQNLQRWWSPASFICIIRSDSPIK